MKCKPRFMESGWMCPHCEMRRDNQHYTMHSPNCLYCGAALFAFAKARDGTVKASTMLDWTRFGWTSEQIKTAAMKRQFVQPLEKTK